MIDLSWSFFFGESNFRCFLAYQKTQMDETAERYLAGARGFPFLFFCDMVLYHFDLGKCCTWDFSFKHEWEKTNPETSWHFWGKQNRSATKMGEGICFRKMLGNPNGGGSDTLWVETSRSSSMRGLLIIVDKIIVRGEPPKITKQDSFLWKDSCHDFQEGFAKKTLPKTYLKVAVKSNRSPKPTPMSGVFPIAIAIFQKSKRHLGGTIRLKTSSKSRVLDLGICMDLPHPRGCELAMPKFVGHVFMLGFPYNTCFFLVLTIATSIRGIFPGRVPGASQGRKKHHLCAV